MIDHRKSQFQPSWFRGRSVGQQPLNWVCLRAPMCRWRRTWRSCVIAQTTTADRLCHLKASLEGNAAALVWELSPECTEAELFKLLHNRYGNKKQIETRRRRKGESLQSLHQDICRLLALSYPGETSALSKIVARDAFLDVLDSAELRVNIPDKDASSLDDAYSKRLRDMRLNEPLRLRRRRLRPRMVVVAERELSILLRR